MCTHIYVYIYICVSVHIYTYCFTILIVNSFSLLIIPILFLPLSLWILFIYITSILLHLQHHLQAALIPKIYIVSSIYTGCVMHGPALYLHLHAACFLLSIFLFFFFFSFFFFFFFFLCRANFLKNFSYFLLYSSVSFLILTLFCCYIYICIHSFV